MTRENFLMLNPKIWPTCPPITGSTGKLWPRHEGRSLYQFTSWHIFSATRQIPKRKEGKRGRSNLVTGPAPKVTQEIRNSSFPGDEEGLRESRSVRQWMSLHKDENLQWEKYLVPHSPSGAWHNCWFPIHCVFRLHRNRDPLLSTLMQQ